MSDGLVYFIECAGRIKIGFTKKTVIQRLRELVTGAPDKLNVLAAIRGSVPFERAIHEAAKAHRIKGEWFSDCAEVRQLMTDLIERGVDAINFIEPPRRQKLKVVGLPKRDPLRSPLRPVYDRIDAAIEYYAGDKFKKARVTEQSLGLPEGQIVNKIIKGHFSAERFGFAVYMMRHTSDRMTDLYESFMEAIMDGVEDINQETLVPRATYLADRLERGLKRLFASPDLSVVDVTGYDGLSIRTSENVAA